MTNTELQHFGIKGMKWGFRKSDGSVGSSGGSSREHIRAEKKAAQAEQHWERTVKTSFPYELHNRAADRMNNGGIQKLNASPKHKDVDVRKGPDDPKVRAYYNDYTKLFNKYLSEESKHFRSPSGAREVRMTMDLDSANGFTWNVEDVK